MHKELIVQNLSLRHFAIASNRTNRCICWHSLTCRSFFEPR